MITVYHLDLMIETWRSRMKSAQFHQRSENCNLFSYMAARSVEHICSARIELARSYRSRLQKENDNS